MPLEGTEWNECSCVVTTIILLPADEVPRPKDFISLKWRDKSDRVRVYKLREAFSPYWKDLGKLFGFHLSLLSTFETRRREDSEQCFDDVLSEWRSNGSVPPGSYPVTWGGLIGALQDLGRMGREVDKLSSALSNRVEEEEEGAGGEGEDGCGAMLSGSNESLSCNSLVRAWPDPPQEEGQGNAPYQSCGSGMRVADAVAINSQVLSKLFS